MNNEQILKALELRKTNTIAAVREQIKSLYGLDVPQSTMQKTLAKLDGCTTVEEIEAKRGPQAQTRRKPGKTTTSKKRYSDETIYLGNKVLTGLSEHVEEVLGKTEMVMPVNGPTIDLRNLVTILDDVKKYVNDKLKTCQMKTSIEEPEPVQEELPILTPTPEPKPDPSQVGKVPEQPYETHTGYTHEATPETPSPQFTDKEELENRVHAQYGFGEEPPAIAEMLGITLDEVVGILNLNQTPPQETTLI